MPASRKTTRAPLSEPARLNVDYWETEDVWAQGLSAKRNMERFTELCNKLKGQMVLLSQKRQSEEGAEQLEKKQMKDSCIAIMIALRRLNRLDKHRLKSTRDAVKDNRARVDALHLQLQNLAYEAGHLRSEVNRCLEFRSMHEQIELVPLDEFIKKADPEVTMSENQHEITMARLQHELSMRHELASRLDSSVSRKNALIADITSKEALLSKVQPTLNNILDAAQPLYSHLGMTLQVNQPEHANAQSLCRALYVIYVEGHAFHEVYPEMLDSVAIEGDVEEAKRVLNKITGNEEESDSDTEEKIVVKKKKRKSRTSSKTANQEEKNQMKASLRPFPLSVKLVLRTESGKLFTLSFSYLTSLKIVCAKLEVEILGVDTFLDGLYENDNGAQSPNPTTQYLLAKNGVENLDRVLSLCKLGKPYQWAQWLAGLDFLSPSQTSNIEMTRKHFEQTLRLIRERLQTRVVLNEQLGDLAAGRLVPDASRFPGKVSSTLQAFKKISMEDAMMKIGFGKTADSVKDMMTKDSLFFDALIVKENENLSALVAVPQTYPKESPFWFFSHGRDTSLTNGRLRALERTVNCFSGGQPSLLLSLQAMQAVVSFDVFLDVDELKVIRRTSGKDRAKPFNYEPTVGIFTPC